ncbi:hypothetical protein EC988_008845, partial [Linderina pennispora]
MGYAYGLRIGRKALLGASFVLTLGVLIANSISLSFQRKNALPMHGVKGSSGWTMFVTVVGIIAIPIIALPTRLQKHVNRTGIELSALAVLTLFWFIASIAMATKSGEKSCMSRRLCHRVRAATAFSWLTFFAMFGCTVTVGLIARLQAKLGMPLFSSYTSDIQGDESNPEVAHAHLHASSIEKIFGLGDDSLYNSQYVATPENVAG